jgi:hypothetical protein
MPFDESFTTFALLTDFAMKLLEANQVKLPHLNGVPQVNKATADLIHEYAKYIPSKLASLRLVGNQLLRD